MIIQIALGIVLGGILLVALFLLFAWFSRIGWDEVGEWIGMIVGIIFLYFLFAHNELVMAILSDIYG